MDEINTILATNDLERIKQLLKEFTQNYMCELHNEKIQFYCKEENKYICPLDLLQKEDYRRVVQVTKSDIQERVKGLQETLKKFQIYIGQILIQLERVYNLEIKNIDDVEEILRKSDQLSTFAKLDFHSKTTPTQTDLTNILTTDKGIFQSKILTKTQEVELINTWLPDERRLGQLIYRSSDFDHAVALKNFHATCGDFQGSVTIVKFADRIFGGFTSKKWSQIQTGYFQDPLAFLFSITYKRKYGLKAADSQHSIYSHKNLGPTFGGGYDLKIIPGSDQCSSRLGHTYVCDYDSQSEEAKTLLAGVAMFQPTEIEVYTVSL